jgi:hypothetical protein
MTPVSSTVYTAQFGFDSAPGDDFEYLISASDPGGRTAATDAFFIWLMYPEADTSRFHDLHQWGASTSSAPVSVYMDLHNTGNDTLLWSLDYGQNHRFDTLPLPPAWTYTHTPANAGDWTLSTNRFRSPPSALYSRFTVSPSANVPVMASVDLPPITLGHASRLAFAYWIHDEVQPDAPTLAWDGGIVEISTNNGVSFAQLPGPYTHSLTNWTASPWPADTPCFSGTGTEGWRTATFHLDAFDGQTVRFRFTHGGDNNTHYEGWYLDDVCVTTGFPPSGFTHDIAPAYAYAIPPGGMKRILWTATPALMPSRNNATSVFIMSNDPASSFFAFDWHYLFRDAPPDIHAFTAQQVTDGSGNVALNAALSDPDQTPVTLTLEWRSDATPAWQPLPVPQIPTPLATNLFSSVWPTRSLIDATTQLFFRVSADNGYLATNAVFGPFAVDNIPPVFSPGPLAFAPAGYGDYVTHPFTVSWPAATDNAPGTIRYYGPFPATNDYTTGTSAPNPPHVLDTVNSYAVTARDTAGNDSPPLSGSVLVLNPVTDFDGDGFTTAQEEALGYDATRFTCPLDLDAFTLIFPTVASRRYTVEATPTLQPPDWQSLLPYTNLPGNGVPRSIPLPDAAPAMFFRVIVTP